MTTLTVKKITPSTKNVGVNVVTLTSEQQDALLGKVKSTFYIATTNQFKEGQQLPVDIEKYDVVARDYTSPEGVAMKLKWLYLKR